MKGNAIFSFCYKNKIPLKIINSVWWPNTFDGSLYRIAMCAWNIAILLKTMNLLTLIDFPFLSIHGFWVKYREVKSERLESFIGFLIEEPTWKMVWEDLFAWATMAIIIEFTTISAGISMTFKIQYGKIVEKT